MDYQSILNTALDNYATAIRRELRNDWYFGLWRLMFGLPWPASDPNPMPRIRLFRWLPR